MLFRSLSEMKDLFSKFLWDNKYTEKKSYRINGEDWEKLRDDARDGYLPGMQIEIRNPSFNKIIRLVVLEENDFLFLRDSIDLLTEEVNKWKEQEDLK